MTKNRQMLHRTNSPIKSPRRHNSSLRKKALVRRISGEVQFGSASKANLKVVVRVRPQNQLEKDRGARCVVDVLDEHMLVFDPVEDTGGFFFKGTKQRHRDLTKRQPLEKKFVFEHVFGDQSTNTELYEATAHPLIDTLLQGYNCCVFAYGATGAGKTYTMLGRQECPGITSLTLQELYQRLDQLKGHRRCEVAVSYLEVYNETVRDLLGSRKPLALQEIGQQVMVPGLSLHKPNNAEELLQMLAQGNSNRTQHATDANAESSRSHAVFQIFVRQQDIEVSTKATVTISKLSMIDLAGSERGAATGFRGARFKEGSSINKSLLALGNCINALADGQRHIPYRDSKLTRLLKDSLGGNCRSVMIAALSSASTTFEDSYNTLRYADRAKTIRTTIRNNVKNVNQHVSDYIKVVAGLRDEVTSLREKLKEYQEKEQKWESQQSDLTAATTATATTTTTTSTTQTVTPPRPSASPQQQMEREKVEEEISEEEVEAQHQLKGVSDEQKALRQELLKLESTYKATELKRYHWMARLSRVKVVAFASCKLDKTVNKCERTINALDTKLSAIAMRIETVKRKVEGNQVKMQEAEEALTCFGTESGHFSKHSLTLVEKHKANISMRDRQHLVDHLQTLLHENMKEQHTSEQLVHVLLGGVRDLYLKFRQKEQCCSEVRGIFQCVVDGLDECRIAWADQQPLPEGEDGQVACRGEPAVTKLDANYCTILPSLSPIDISPAVMCEPTTSFRKSSLMATGVNVLVPVHHQPAADSVPAAAVKAQPRLGSPPPLESQESSHTGVGSSLNSTITLSSPVFVSQSTQPQVFTDTEEGFANVQGSQQSTSIASNSPVKINSDNASVSRLSSITSAQTLNATFDCVSASRLSSISSSCNTLKNTTVNMPSHNADLIDPPSINTTTTISPLPLASRLSTITVTLTPSKAINNTMDIKSPFSLSTHITPTFNSEKKLSMAYSDTKLLHATSSASQLCSTQVQAPVISVCGVLPSSTTTTTTTCPAVARELFSTNKKALNSTFNVENITEDPSVCPLSADLSREPPMRSPGVVVGLNTVPTRSPLVPVNRSSHSNLLDIPEKQTVKPTLVRTIRTTTNKKLMNRTPHKALIQSWTPGKGVGREAGMRRSVSTPSLISQQSSTRKLANTKSKLKGLGGTLQRTTSFLKNKTTTNQENLPPHSTRVSSGVMHRPSSTYKQLRSPGPLNKT